MGNQPSVLCLAAPKTTTTLYYHTACKKFYARAIPIVLTLEQAGVKYDILGTDDVPEGEGFVVPMLTFDDGQTISQTPVIVDGLGEKYGLNGKTVQEKRKNFQTMLDFNDFVSEMRNSDLANKPERFDKWMSAFESRLQGKFFGGLKPSVGDFYGVFAAEIIILKTDSIDAEKYPKFAQWWMDVCEVPVVKKMKEDKVSMLPPFLKK